MAQPHNQQWLQEVGYSDNLSTQYLPAQQAIVATRTIEPLNATDTAPLQLIATYDLSPVIAELEQQFTVKLALLFLLLMALLTGLLVFIRRYIHSPINYLIKVGKQLTSQSQAVGQQFMARANCGASKAIEYHGTSLGGELARTSHCDR